MSRHSKLPWRVAKVLSDSSGPGEGYNIISETQHDRIPAYNNFGACSAEDAALIVRAVNSHQALVDALAGILNIGKRDLSNPKYDGYFDAAQKALTEAVKP